MSDTGDESMTDLESANIRWKVGHQALHVYLVTINTILEESTSAIADDNRERLVTCFVDLTILYDATTSSMEYTADFPRDLYVNSVRPSMTPPTLPPGFSGSLNTEHRLMTSGLNAISKALLKAYGGDRNIWPPAVAESWVAVRRARFENLRRHKLVCERFVSDGASLLRQHLER